MSVVTKFLLTILIFMYLSETPLAEQRQQCVPSSCGHIHNISYPFRLKSDPKHCGLENYELSCEGDHTLLTIPPHDWHGSLNYYVQAINYANSTIRLVDPGIREQVICSLPQNWITTLFDFDSYIFKMPEFVYLTVPITLFSCPFALNSPDFVEITNCLNRSYASNVSSDSFKGHTYATMAELSPSDLKVGCTVDLISMTSWRNKDANANISILSLHNALAYGFELSWFRQVYCGKCANSMICEGENSSDVHCLDLTCEDHYFRFFKLLIVGDFAAIIPWILPIAETPLAEQRQQCVPSSCGHIHNISYPFRLKSDPKHCGLENYELSCEGDRAIITIRYGVHIPLNYYVQAINYDNSTIRLTDPGIREQVICSLPQNSITTLVGFDSQIYTITDFVKLTVPITLFSCPFAINSPVFVEITSCLNRSYASNVSSDSFKGHTYATMAELSPSDLKVGCTVDLISMTSWRIQDANANISILSLHNALAYGFELSWFQHVHCGKCANSCEGKNSSDVRCVDYNCKTYNFRFFKSSCAYYSLVLDTIIPWILPIAGPSIVARIVLFPCIVVFLMIKLRRRHLSIYDAIESFLDSENNFAPIRYSNSNIRKMTRNFKEKLGQGGYGSVYKGKLQSGPNVAVKILSKPKADGQDFINEVATIGRIHHVNIVQLIGYCAERCKRALVYDFMPNGSLEKYITPRERGGDQLLSWDRKFEIALGVARGIEYLHRGCDFQILHFDIKPHNILLDENFIPKLSDFGLAKSYPTDKSIVTLTAARGTIGYVAPELINRSIGPISYKADVYSFGMLLIDIVGLKTNSAAREDMSSQYFPHWIYDQLDKGKEIEVLDETHEDIKKLTLVALWCIQMNPLDRPSMTKVVEMLEGELQALQTPPRPSESREPCSLEFNLISSSISSTESVKLLESCFDSAKIDVIVA